MINDEPHTIHQELRDRRVALKLSRRELAGRLLITERTLVRWEAGERANPLHPLLRNNWMREIEKEEAAVLKAIRREGRHETPAA